jgi:septal ring factor EnvC (AmiA/AmiB activator)
MGLSQSHVKENAELREQLEGALQSLEEQHAQLMAQLQTQHAVVLKLSERIDELNNTIVSKEIEIRQLHMVRRNKLILLNEFKHLYAKFNQQMSINVPPV